jgi:hypothetical protein
MSTRSAIGLKLADGKVKAIYCHWDGYLDGVGKILCNYYKDEETIKKLLDLGDLSGLGKIPEVDETYWDASKFHHNYDLCSTYASRGDEDTEAITFNNEEEYLDYYDLSVDYIYLFKDGKWYYYTLDLEDFTPIEKPAEKIEENLEEKYEPWFSNKSVIENIINCYYYKDEERTPLTEENLDDRRVDKISLDYGYDINKLKEVLIENTKSA